MADRRTPATEHDLSQSKPPAAASGPSKVGIRLFQDRLDRTARRGDRSRSFQQLAFEAGGAAEDEVLLEQREWKKQWTRANRADRHAVITALVALGSCAFAVFVALRQRVTRASPARPAPSTAGVEADLPSEFPSPKKERAGERGSLS